MELDGNAIGGLLQLVFEADMTTAEVTCGTCGATGAVAQTITFLRGPGSVVRCRHCSNLLIVICRIHGMNCVDLRGLSALHPRPALELTAVAVVPSEQSACG